MPSAAAESSLNLRKRALLGTRGARVYKGGVPGIGRHMSFTERHLKIHGHPKNVEVIL